MEDFIFGPLPPAAERVQQIIASRSGLTHRQARSPLHPHPGQPVTLTFTAGPTHLIAQAWVYWTTDGSDPAAALGAPASAATHVTPMQPSGSAWDTPLWGYVREFRAELPAQPAGAVVRYRIAAADRYQAETFADDGVFYAYYVDNDPPPAWTRQAVLYQIFVDRFAPPPGTPWRAAKNLMDFYGGTLNGITSRLDDLQALGITALWLSPIFPSPTHHGYDASDYFSVEPRLGSLQDLRALLDSAHARGMRVLLDLVPNHISNLHPHFADALSRPDSPYRDWFTFAKWPGRYATFFGSKHMPKLNLRHPAARQYMLDAAAHWLNFGVDGFRVDHAIGPAPDFWADFRRVTRAANPESWTFGEVTEPPQVQLQFSGGLDGCLDFNLAEALRQAFGRGGWSAARLIDFLERHDEAFPPTFSRPSFIDNHDMNRFLWLAGGDQRRMRLAVLCQFSLPGQPVIYYGSEVGLSQQYDVHARGRLGLDEARMPYPWEQPDTDLRAFYQQVIALRRSEALLAAGARSVLHTGEQTLAYRLSGDGRAVCVALNLADSPAEIAVAGEWTHVLAASQPGCAVEPGSGRTRITLPALGGLYAA